MLFRYGTAVHLALLTVAPLFLFSVCGPSVHAVFLVGLTLLAALWIVMNPSPRAGEWPRDARRRIGLELARDPFLTFGVIALVFSAVRAANGGVALDYSAQTGLWHLKDAFVVVLPGSVTGAGVLPLAGVFALVVAVLGVRHALGSHARFAYVFLCGVFGALAVLLWWVLTRLNVAIPHLAFLPADPFCLASLSGICFLFALVAWVESWREGVVGVEIVASLSVAVLLTGLLCVAPTVPLFVFGGAGALILATGFGLCVLRRPVTAWLRTFIAAVIVSAPIVLFFTGDLPQRTFLPLLPEGFAALRETATTLAVRAWESAPRMGVGLGAYPFALGFFASPDDWQVLSAAQTAAPNGWAHFLFERGLLGAVVLLAGAALLLRDGILRYVRANAEWTLSVAHLLGPVVLLVAAALTFFECTFVQPEALMIVGAALALTAAAFPEQTEIDNG